jgi:SNF2 family DNA or RNA helicase
LLHLLLNSTPEQRFLVFSSHEASFRGLKQILAGKGIRSELLIGTTSHINKVKNQFTKGTIRVLYMNARHVGAGLNLESTTDIVLYHRMNGELERQMIGRAVRFDRSAPLTVTHLEHPGEEVTTSYTASTMDDEILTHV